MKIRYEIESDLPGLIIDAPGIIGVCATRGRTEKALIIVYVEAKSKKDFEKAVEGNAHVLSYRADPDSGKEAKYARH